MLHENLVMRNLSVLERLARSDATLIELAQSAKCRQGDLSSSLQILQEQRLVSQSGERYQLANHEATAGIIETINPWIAYFNGKFYDIAKDTAKSIHEKALDASGVVDVILYGSTLSSESPKDIDMLVIHDGGRLRAFSPYSTLRVDEPIGKENARDSAYGIFRQLGYKHDDNKTDTVAVAVGKRIEGLNAGTVTDEQIAGETKLWKDWCEKEYGSFELADRLDIHGINNVFDVIVLHVGALMADANDQVAGIYGTITGMRKSAVESCRDPTFWHTILSEGRIYDREKHDFSIKVEDKYAGAVDLFPSK